MKKRMLIATAVFLGILAPGWTALGQDPGPPVGGQPERHMQIRRWTGPGQDLPPGRPGMGGGGPEWGGFAGREGGLRMAGRLMAALENDRVKAYLNLTEPQADRLRQILVDTEKASVKTRADMAVRGIELRELLRADKPDRAAVIRKVQELSELRGQMMKQHVEALLAAKDVLTPEQQKKIRAFIQNRAAFGGGRMGFGPRREGPGPRRPETMPRPPAPPANPGDPPVQ